MLTPQSTIRTNPPTICSSTTTFTMSVRLHKGVGAFEKFNTGGNTFQQNYMHDLPRWGIALPYVAANNNVMKYNEIRNSMEETGDGGAIHNSSLNHNETGTEIGYNLIAESWGLRRNTAVHTKLLTTSTVFIWMNTPATHWIHDNAIRDCWDGYFSTTGKTTTSRATSS